VFCCSGELVQKLADDFQQMRQPVRAVETLLSWVDVNLLQFDQSAAGSGEFMYLQWIIVNAQTFFISFSMLLSKISAPGQIQHKRISMPLCSSFPVQLTQLLS